MYSTQNFCLYLTVIVTKLDFNTCQSVNEFHTMLTSPSELVTKKTPEVNDTHLLKLNTVYKSSNQAPNTQNHSGAFVTAFCAMLISPSDLAAKVSLEVNDTYLSKVKTLSTNVYHLQDLIN